MANAGSLLYTKTAGCGPGARAFQDHGRLESEYHLKKGDIVYFNWDNGSSSSSWVNFPSVDHVGIAISDVDSGGYFYSIEGNTGGSSNGQVLKQRRNISVVSCVGHPAYPSTKVMDAILNTALAEVGTAATNVKRCKYNTWYWGSEVSGDMYDWCQVFVDWVFYHTNLDGSSSSGGSSSSNKGKVRTTLYLRVLGKDYENRTGQVKNLQRILSAPDVNYKGKDGKTLKIDGVWGENTEYALKNWQKKHGLTANGVFDEKNQDKFYSTDS